MAFYDGFFDAALDENEQYDRLYSAAEHMEFYSHIIGSGVCIVDNPNSFKVTLSGRVATIAAGYLFINGYWLKSTANYSITLPSTGSYAICAILDLTSRQITLDKRTPASSYNGALCLAVCNIDVGTCEDTRGDSSVCGFIDTAGSMSDKAIYAKNYIDNEVEGRLQDVETALQDAVDELENKVVQVTELASQLGFPAVGEIKYSYAALSNKWLRCDGRFVSEENYPDLVALFRSGEVPGAVQEFLSLDSNHASNVVIYDGFAWVVDYTRKRLLGVSLSDSTDTREMNIDSMMASKFVIPTSIRPLALSIINQHIYLAQISDTNKLVLAMALFLNSQMRDFEVVYNATQTATDSISVPTAAQAKALRCITPYAREIAGGFCIVTNVAVEEYIPATSGSGSTDYRREWQPTSYLVCNKLPEANQTYSASDYSVGYVTASFRYIVKQTNNVWYGYPGIGSYHGYAFSRKNGNEVIAVSRGAHYQETANVSNLTASTYLQLTSESKTVQIYYNDRLYKQGTGRKTVKVDSIVQDDWYTDTTSCLIPVCSDSHILYSVIISSNVVKFYFVDRAMTGIYEPAAEITLPAGSTIFQDCAVCVDNSFYVFTGKGVLIVDDPADASSIKYIDTTGFIGTVISAGCINYDEESYSLIISGITSNSKLVIYSINIRTLVSSEGAYLPVLNRSGVYAYIKAVEG